VKEERFAMQTATTTAQTIIEQIKVLPPESLDDLASYVEFLRYRARRVEETKPAEERLTIVKLGGILKGYDVDVSPESLAEARREMWRKYEDADQ
jgi:hypothetical protein